MLKKNLFIVLMLSGLLTAFNMKSNAVEVTFKVDMADQTVSTLGIHVAGSFQGWDPAGTEMTLLEDTVYSVTIDLTAGEAIEYKFVNGNAWGMDETVPAGCALNGNRFLTVPAQNLVLQAVCFGSCTVCNPPLVEITLQVDMSNETVSPNGIHVAGSFQGWDPAGTEMFPVGDDVYSVTVEMEAGNYHEYKFVNGNAWGDDETVPPECAIGWNRYINVPFVPTTLDAVCFGSCYPCGPPPVDINVTFRVDMTEQILSPNGVHIAGGFQGWDPGATLMTDAGDNIYTHSAIFPSGTYQEYKYINGTTWEESEMVPPECNFNGNRYFSVPLNDTIIPVVCYSSCDPCGPPPVDVNVTFQIDMSDETVSTEGIHVTGSFQGWDPASTTLTDLGDDIYAVTIVLSSGGYHEFKYVNGITFDDVESVPEECGVPDGQGGFNRYFTVPVNDTTLPALCFGSCEACPPPMPEHNVTFKVDMSNETISNDGIHLAGTFQGWNASSTEMTNTIDNIYEITLLLEEGDAHEFKYINGNTFENAENVPPECSMNGNRYLTVPAADTVMTALCFGSCDPCGPPPVDIDVTFQIDLSEETVSPDGIHVAGSFQGWNPSTTEMTDLGDNIYAVTLTLGSGDYHTYKFVNGNSFAGVELVPEACGVPDGLGGFARYLTVPQNDTTLTALCFASCEECPPPLPEHNVTFRVDMSNETVAAEGVHIAGTFQGWDPGATMMTETTDNVFEVTFSLEEGDEHQYKFVNGDEWGEDETVPAECAIEGNRYLTVPTNDIILTDVCYGSCDTCIIIGINEHGVADENDPTYQFHPNPATNMLYFMAGDALLTIQVFSTQGSLILEQTITNGSLDISVLEKGLYFIRIKSGKGEKTRKLIISS